ncbi:MAG: Holliday junction branch migration protein RuvA [Candidatus Levybacteria bacterium]|nr:Holliday junction branch migration protein RuvA [Candidatus Levybacteria bacterium]
MIGFLKGNVVARDSPYIILDVGGVGYRVTVPKSVFSKSGSNGQKFKLFTYTHVRDDALELFGFEEAEDLKLFKYLISVSGIGPKTAMNIFGIGDRKSIAGAIIKGDVGYFTGVPRLGKKNAQKIIIELKNKFGESTDLDLSANSEEDDEVIAGLLSFGFLKKEALDSIRALKGKGKTTEEKIRLALKYLGKK